MAEQTERRTLETHELRTIEADNGAKVLVGYAARFNCLSGLIGGEFREEIAPGAFAEALRGDVRALYNHDPSQVLGRSTNGTLILAEDGEGLLVSINLPDTSYAQDLWRLVQRGDVSQMSFGFSVGKSGQEWRKDGGVPIRRVTKVSRLLDVSPVTYPAYPQTSVQARDIEAAFAADEVDAQTGGDDTGAAATLPTQEAKRTRVLKLLRAME